MARSVSRKGLSTGPQWPKGGFTDFHAATELSVGYHTILPRPRARPWQIPHPPRSILAISPP